MLCCAQLSCGRGPIFFYTGNEGAIWGFYNNTGFVFDIAPEFNALIVFAEHRYYGESMPYGSNSFNRTNIGHLSMEQALADYATLLLALKPQYNNAPVVTFGGSYGGMLSGWMRMKYPFVVDMALAASAPYMDFTTKIDVFSFFGNITNTFRDADVNCPSIIQSGFTSLRALGNEGASGLAQLTEAFKLCTPLKASQVEHLILWAVNAFTTLSMCDYPYATDFCANLPAWPVVAACQGALAAPDALSGLAFAASLAYNGSSSMQCFDIESEYIECADQTGCGTGPSGTAWDYQACTESVFLPTTNGLTDMFLARSWTLTDLTDYCMKKFGVKPRQSWLMTEFGADNIASSASNIIFSNGLLDPWHAGGILSSLSPTLPAILIAVSCHLICRVNDVLQDGAHHLDLRASNPEDPESVIQARQQEVAFFKLWLSELQGNASRTLQ